MRSQNMFFLHPWQLTHPVYIGIVVILISGEYLVSVKFNDQHIPDSPFKVYLAPSSGDIQKLNVSDLQEHGLQVCLP